MPSHKYKTPNRRRISKWINRTRRTLLRANARGFSWFINQLPGEAQRNAAALRAGVNLAAAAGYYLPEKRSYAQLDAMLSRLLWSTNYVRRSPPRPYSTVEHAWMRELHAEVRDEVPTRRNLEI